MKNERDKNSDKEEQFDSFGSDDDEVEAVYGSDEDEDYEEDDIEDEEYEEDEEDEDDYDEEDSEEEEEYEDDGYDGEYSEEDEEYNDEDDDSGEDEEYSGEDEDYEEDEEYEDEDDYDETEEDGGNLRKRLGVVAGIVSVIVVVALIVVWAGGTSPSNTGTTTNAPVGGAGSSQSNDVAGYEAKVKASPNDINVLYGLGHSYNNTKSFSKGEEIFRKIVSLQPGDPEAYTDLGISLEGQGKYDEALQQYDEAIKIDPKYSFALWSKGAFYAGVKKDYNEALKWYEEALKAVPQGSSEYNQIKKYIDELNVLKSQPAVPSPSN